MDLAVTLLAELISLVMRLSGDAHTVPEPILPATVRTSEPLRVQGVEIHAP